MNQACVSRLTIGRGLLTGLLQPSPPASPVRTRQLTSMSHTALTLALWLRALRSPHAAVQRAPEEDTVYVGGGLVTLLIIIFLLIWLL